MQLRSKNALVTGATGGLGVAQSEALARAGAAVLMVDIKGGAAAETINARLPDEAPKLRFVHCDLVDPRAAQRLVRELDAEVGGIDVLINNAAINPLKPIDGYPLEEYERVQAINATAAVALAQAVVPSMKRKGWGQIVNICSVTLNGGWSDFTAYVASKGTLLGLTRAMARELGKFGIRVNAVRPGPTHTEMLDNPIHAGRLEEMAKVVPLKRVGKPEEIAAPIVWLLSDEASFVVGTSIIASGGR